MVFIDFIVIGLICQEKDHRRQCPVFLLEHPNRLQWEGRCKKNMLQNDRIEGKSGEDDGVSIQPSEQETDIVKNVVPGGR